MNQPFTIKSHKLCFKALREAFQKKTRKPGIFQPNLWKMTPGPPTPSPHTDIEFSILSFFFFQSKSDSRVSVVSRALVWNTSLNIKRNQSSSSVITPPPPPTSKHQNQASSRVLNIASQLS